MEAKAPCFSFLMNTYENKWYMNPWGKIKLCGEKAFDFLGTNFLIKFAVRDTAISV